MPVFIFCEKIPFWKSNADVHVCFGVNVGVNPLMTAELQPSSPHSGGASCRCHSHAHDGRVMFEETGLAPVCWS